MRGGLESRCQRPVFCFERASSRSNAPAEQEPSKAVVEAREKLRSADGLDPAPLRRACETVADRGRRRDIAGLRGRNASCVAKGGHAERGRERGLQLQREETAPSREHKQESHGEIERREKCKG